MALDSEFLDPGEKIMEVVRRHWINLAPIWVAWFIVGATVLSGFYFLGRFGDQLGQMATLTVGLVAAMTLVVLFVYLSYWVYRQNRLILTDKNFIQIDRRGIIHEIVTQYTWDKIQDVTSEQKGVLAHLLGYGDLVIETAGELPNLRFYQVAFPKDVANRVMRLHEQAIAASPQTAGNP